MSPLPAWVQERSRNCRRSKAHLQGVRRRWYRVFPARRTPWCCQRLKQPGARRHIWPTWGPSTKPSWSRHRTVRPIMCAGVSSGTRSFVDDFSVRQDLAARQTALLACAYPCSFGRGAGGVDAGLWRHSRGGCRPLQKIGETAPVKHEGWPSLLRTSTTDAVLRSLATRHVMCC